MKAGVRAVGIAESFTTDRSTLAGVVVRADRVIDGVTITSCTVGGTDATRKITELLNNLNREDHQYVIIAGIAPAWYNIIDIYAISESANRPVISVTFEESAGLETVLTREFNGDDLADRLSTYRDQPARKRVRINDQSMFIRAVGIPGEEARDVIRAFTPEGGRPEPVRIARLVARAADRWRAV